jgi:putative autotransporter adhesin-like protein
MKRRQLLGAAGAAGGMALLGACTTSTVLDGNPSAVRGSGRVIQESRSISGVRALEIGGSARLELVLDVAESLIVEAEDNIMPLLRVDLADGTLALGLQPNTSISTTKGILFKLSVPRALDSLKMTGSTSARVAEIKGGGRARLTLDGSSRANFGYLEIDSIDVDLRGSSELTIQSGLANDQQVKVLNSSSYVAEGFQTSTGTVTALNSGRAVVNVAKSLDATAENSSSVRYVGSPSVAKHVKDSGKVEPR